MNNFMSKLKLWLGLRKKTSREKMQEVYNCAKKELGVSEIPGKVDNERIKWYHTFVFKKAKSEVIAWCSSFMNAMFSVCGYLGTQSPLARSWLKWGKRVDVPYEGCVMVLARGSQAWQGHVNFYVRSEGNYVYGLGGNQSNMVKISRYHKSKVLGYREIE